MKKNRIILAEDESTIREVLYDLLVDEGFECVTASDGLEATKKLAEENFDLLISDFRMPKMDGAQLLKWCRDNKIHLPVIFITANKELLPEEASALQDQNARLLRKPIDFNHLIETITSATSSFKKIL